MFRNYLKAQKRALAAFFLFAVIFAVSFLLYRLPLQAVIYPFCLCLLIGFVFFGIGYYRFARKHGLLTDLARLKAAMEDALPECENTEEADYQALIAVLCAEIRENKSLADSTYREMIDYYTVWVHQIKTPIASMKLALQNEDTPAARRLSSDLFRIEQYVEMVLAYLRIDSDDTDYVFTKLDADEVMRRSVKKFAHDFIGRKIALEYEPLNLQFITDEKWLSFVFEQLLSNALKYTPAGSIRIYPENGSICIADTGIGIAPQDLPRIFEKGYTGLNGRRDKSSSGLGLYLTKKVCDRLGLTVTVESAVGTGTVLKLTPEETLQ